MNRLVVRQATAGLVRFLPEGATVADRVRRPPQVRRLRPGRGGGGRRRRGPGPAPAPAACPTPVLAFAVRHLGADAGVMVTASHNPPADNGYKVYLGDGAQIVPPADAEIAAAIDAVATEGRIEVAEPDDPAIEVLGGECRRLPGRPRRRCAGRRPGRANSSTRPCTASGRDVLLAAFGRAGFPAPDVVAEQSEPDPDFPTVAFPNPEEPGALDLALAQAQAPAPTSILANDPDADRLGVAVPDGGDWRSLTGDEIGSLLADHVLRNTEATTASWSRPWSRPGSWARWPRPTACTSPRRLTGFKWIVRPALEHPEWRFVFGYEEALGYLVGDAVRDKDGISAALAFAGLVADLRTRGQTVHDRLAALAEEHGLHATRPLTAAASRGLDGRRASSTRWSARRRAAHRGCGWRDGRVRPRPPRRPRCSADRRPPVRPRRRRPGRHAPQRHRAQAQVLPGGRRTGRRRPRRRPLPSRRRPHRPRHRPRPRLAG